jgi:hypothetical protein
MGAGSLFTTADKICCAPKKKTFIKEVTPTKEQIGLLAVGDAPCTDMQVSAR